MNPEVIAILGGFGMTVGIPLVWILTNHQRKMAELIHNKGNNQTQSNVVSQDTQLIVQELRAMRSELASLTIAVDNLKDQQSVPLLSDNRINL